jgi:hypothetical protein
MPFRLFRGAVPPDSAAPPADTHCVVTRRWLARSWVLVFPGFAALVARTIYERAFLNLQEVWPWLHGRPLLAFAVGTLYVVAHWWCLAWYVMAMHRTQRPVPSLADLIDEGRPYLLVIAAAWFVLAVEYSPIRIWRWLAYLTTSSQ